MSNDSRSCSAILIVELDEQKPSYPLKAGRSRQRGCIKETYIQTCFTRSFWAYVEVETSERAAARGLRLASATSTSAWSCKEEQETLGIYSRKEMDQ